MTIPKRTLRQPPKICLKSDRLPYLQLYMDQDMIASIMPWPVLSFNLNAAKGENRFRIIADEESLHTTGRTLCL